MSGGGSVSSDNEFTAKQAEIAASQNDTYNELYKPLERTAIEGLGNLNSESAYRQASAGAIGEVSSAFDAQRNQLMRSRESMGMFSTLDDLDSLKLSIGEATAKSLASNRGRQMQYGQYLGALQNAVNTGRSTQGDAGRGFAQLSGQRLQADKANADAQAASDAATGALVGTVATAVMM